MLPDHRAALPPHRLMLATDLSSRCDRATDRALQLAGQWGSELVALTVMEQPQMPDQVVDWLQQESDISGERYARRLLRRELEGLGERARMEVARGPVTAAIRERAQALHCRLIVTGVARDEPFGRLLRGSTAEDLARSGAPLLLSVRNRVHEPYRRVLVATDFSAPSRDALVAALRLFAQAHIVLYHAHDVAFAGMVADSAALHAARAMEHEEAPRFLAACGLAPPERGRIKVAVEAGPLELMAARYVRHHDIQLAVLGAKGRSALSDAVLGSSAGKLLEWLPCDTLLVRPGLDGA